MVMSGFLLREKSAVDPKMRWNLPLLTMMSGIFVVMSVFFAGKSTAYPKILCLPLMTVVSVIWWGNSTVDPQMHWFRWFSSDTAHSIYLLNDIDVWDFFCSTVTFLRENLP